ISDGVSPDQIYVGGFSQGATVALDVVLEDERYGALVSMSGGSLQLDLEPLSERSPLRAFVSHGKSDSVLNISKSRAIVAALKAGQHPVEFVEFDGRRVSSKVLTTRDAPEEGVLTGFRAVLDEAGLKAGDIAILIQIVYTNPGDKS
ncbi:MAG: hypothetical protein IIB66_10430, partial [Proteobacteria bacterium]|nr:hypothetical protein [Pseudomonadota bacterium]